MAIEAMGYVVAVAIASFEEAVTDVVTEDVAVSRILPRTDVGEALKGDASEGPKGEGLEGDASEGPKGDANEGPREDVGGLPIAPIAEEGSK